MTMRSSGTIPTAIPTRSKPRITSLQLRDLAAGDRNPGLPRALGETDRDAAEHRRVGFLDRDVIDHRDRPRADADHVVDIHRHAIDADRVVSVHHLRDDRLRPDPVGADRQTDAADIDDIGEIADIQLDCADAVAGPARSALIASTIWRSPVSAAAMSTPAVW